MRYSALRELLPVWPFRTFSPPSKPWNSRCPSWLLNIWVSTLSVWPLKTYLCRESVLTGPWGISQEGEKKVSSRFSLCSGRHLCSFTYSTIYLVLTVPTKVYFSIILSSSDTQVCISAWLVDISSWMSARYFQLITGDNNIVNPAQTTKHLSVIPGSKLSYKALIAATKPSCRYVLWKIGQTRIFTHQGPRSSLFDL